MTANDLRGLLRATASEGSDAVDLAEAAVAGGTTSDGEMVPPGPGQRSASWAGSAQRDAVQVWR